MAYAKPVQALSGPARRAAGSPRRHAYCPLCGQARLDVPASAIRELADALCPGRCSMGWAALAALRLRESASERVAARRRDEYDSRRPHEPALSELLLVRWRGGDWGIAPEDLLEQVRYATPAESV